MEKKHNYGIDLLRIFLMLLIITGHLFVHTNNIRKDFPEFSSKWIFTWSYEAIIVCAVNCFVLITGYFSNNNNYTIRIKKIALLWGQVLFYSIGIYFVLLLTGMIDFSIIEMIHSIFPVLSGQYWFFSSYILLMLLMPFLNYMLSRLNDFGLKLLTAIIIFVFYILPTFSIIFLQFDLTEGMGIIGFVTLYIIGHALKRFEIQLSKFRCILGICINCGVIVFSKFALTYIVNRLQLNVGTALLYHYNSIFQLINATLLLLLFKEIHLQGKIAKAVAFVGSSMFGVYLLHEHPQIRDVIWNDRLYDVLVQSTFLYYIALVLCLPILLFIVCLLLDKIRKWLGYLIAKTSLVRKMDSQLTILEDRLKNKFDGTC